VRQAKDRQRNFLGQRRRLVAHNAGDRVLLVATHLNYRSKLAFVCVGPFLVTAVRVNTVTVDRRPSSGDRRGWTSGSTWVYGDGQHKNIVDIVLARRATAKGEDPQYLCAGAGMTHQRTRGWRRAGGVGGVDPAIFAWAFWPLGGSNGFLMFLM